MSRLRRRNMTPKKPGCRDRILAALRYEEKKPQQLADELFVNRVDVRVHLAVLLRDGLVHRRFRPNRKTLMPDYAYCSVRFPPKYQRETANPDGLLGMVGGWDATDMTWLNKFGAEKRNKSKGRGKFRLRPD